VNFRLGVVSETSRNEVTKSRLMAFKHDNWRCCIRVKSKCFKRWT